nr:protein yippee-like 1 isoform X1 [Crassostrea gigas]
MVKTFQAYLPNECHRKYSCVHCRAHLANHDELISKVSYKYSCVHCRAHLANHDELISKVSYKYSCVHCRAHLANHDELITKSFQGSQGRAYLFNSVVNVGCGPAEERVLLTGLHAVADIFCECCKTTLGWKYEHAFESSQKYKEGKFIIELAHMIKDNGWA